MSTRAFDLAMFVDTPVNVGDGVTVKTLGPPFQTQFSPIPTASAPGVVVGASVPAATAAGQTMVSGAGPGFAWAAATSSSSLPPATAQGQTFVSGPGPGYGWTVQLLPAVPAGANTPPLMDGAAAPGSGAAYARADHIHPTDTSLYPMSNPAGYQTAGQVNAALPAASATPPVMDGAALAGVAATYARGDHVHPTDTTRYAASNPNGYQTAGQVSASISAAAYVLPTASTVALGGVKVDGSTVTIAGGVISAVTSGYTLPTASTVTLGGVKIDGSSITIASGVISAAAGSGYTLPTASTTVLGGVKVDGSTVNIAGGVISVAPPYALPTASTSVLGGVKIDGSTISINNGVISSVSAYTLPTASISTLGGVKIDGSSITIASGVISATPPAPYVLPTASTSTLGGVKIDGSSITISAGVISAPSSGLADAPNDGTSYVRLSGAWSNTLDQGTF